MVREVASPRPGVRLKPVGLIDRLKAALSDRYVIDRQVGQGSNALVFLARDPKYDRQVAIKVLLPDLSASVQSERFLREIQIAAKLTHPRILPLYDSGAADGLLYYVMPFAEGASLRDRLARQPKFPIDEAIRIACDVASALHHAHRQGIVHRDIKPENVLISGGEAVVMDFGIARAISVAGGEKLTQTGMTVGTPAYMSPEQCRGQRELDGRADLYSLACMLYEMLARRPPFVGATAQEVLARHTMDPVPRLKAARADVPDAIEKAIVRALAKKPEDRFADCGAFAEALSGRPVVLPELPPASGLAGIWRTLKSMFVRATRPKWD